MSATYATFLDQIIRDGIAAAHHDYKDVSSHQLQGSLAGFEACRGKTPAELAALLADARRETAEAYWGQAADYWRTRCFEAEVEWVCNCVSAVLRNEGFPVIVPPTARGVQKAAQVVGVSEEP